MSSIGKNNFSIVMNALEKSVDQLKSEKKEEAINTVLGISQEIQLLSTSSEKMEVANKKEQAKLTETLADMIKSEATIRDSYLGTQKSIDTLNVDISKKSTERTELIKHVNSVQRELEEDERSLREHQKKLDELNDSSAWSIIRSICSLGLDRAIMGIQSLINDDTGRIRSLKDQISKFRQELENNAQGIQTADSLLKSLYEQKNLYEVQIAELKSREYTLQQYEKTCRQNLAFITDIALFYGKLSIMLEQIRHRIDDVIDIVSLLNDSTPTIVDFDSSGGTLISLNEALVKFDKILETVDLDSIA
ncbi:hypothetical protein [Inconstantimicrobium mannanitabidum]|uniref:Uncharacterized protein n=1 Tax=Inconstantimicrobium mannanitabidum TaxID=1604901 RepID=A0ACB5R6Y9_9CLOT|nr:hypothetical protein [Clostridium sp. TW13]GKX64789.1 hypothetical protein rsdtw13_00470 [Clostridium sp. TW13]